MKKKTQAPTLFEVDEDKKIISHNSTKKKDVVRFNLDLTKIGLHDISNFESYIQKLSKK